LIERSVVDGCPRPAGAYSHVVRFGDLVMTAGFGPNDPSTGAVPSGIAAQVDATLDNVARALAAVGPGLGDVLKATVHLAELARDFTEFDEVYGRRFDGDRPVRTTVGSELNGILVEIDVIAVASGRERS
jgi:2-iminobutanoate/2-iminopropanoate deaminase